MKKLLLILSAGLLATAGHARADLTIVQKIEGAGQNLESTAFFKGTKTRITTGPTMSIIMDLKSGEMMTVLDSQKSFMKVPAQMQQAAMESMKKMGGDNTAKPHLEATGKKDTISGFAAEEYTTTVAGSKISLWLTKALPDYEKALKEMSEAFKQGPMAAMMANYGMDMETLPGFPVRTVNEIQPGQTMTTTVESVSTKPVADSEFAIPSDYKEISIPSMGASGGGEPAGNGQ